MKMNKEDFRILSEMIIPLRKEAYLIEQAYKKQGVSNKRFRWALLHIADERRAKAGQERFVTTVLYEYLDDTHIDTALRKIMDQSK
jgi:hypothetical protein